MPWPRALSTVEAYNQPVGITADADDDVLVAAARANPDAFTLLYRKYANLVYRYCDLRLGNREAAEDATSEVFLKALAGLKGYRGGVFAGWLFRIARNVVTDAYRARRIDRLAVPIETVADIMDTHSTPEDQAIVRADIDAVRRALQALPDDQRTLLELQITGLTTAEIAATLGRSANAVRILRYRALGRLRDNLRAAGLMPDVIERGGVRRCVACRAVSRSCSTATGPASNATTTPCRRPTWTPNSPTSRR